MPKGNLEHDATTNRAPAQDQIRSIIERIERLTADKKEIAEDIKDVFAESKGHGFDNKIIRIMLKRRAMEAAARAEQDALVHLYSKAIGMKSPADAGTEDADE
jgi:uncharacterized protein (UPF0335 family)